MASSNAAPAATENFADLLEESLRTSSGFDGRVTTGRVISIEGDFAIIDVGLKAEGRVQLKEFATAGKAAEIKVGDFVDVYVERMEDKNGEAMLSREKAKREEAWGQLEKSYSTNARVNGVIFGRVKGGFTVDLGGAVAFLPGSQVDIRPVRDVGPLMGTPQPFQILKMDRSRGNIVVSRRAVLEETRAEQRSELVASLKEGQVLEGVVKNITDYGAFVELEPGIEGLVHVSEMSWTKKNVHPGKIVSTSQEVEVMVLDVDAAKRRISLGLKQCLDNPWEVFKDRYTPGTEMEGEVKNITEFGLFVGLPGDIDGMVHLSDLDWEKAGEEAIKAYKKGDKVKVKVLDVDVEKERISLGVKQLSSDPFESAISGFKKGDVVTGTVSAVQDNGVELTLADGVTGFIRKSDLSRDRAEQRPDRFAMGEKVDAKITTLDRASRKIQLSIKAREIEEDKEAMAQFGSSDSGASLGDILGAALKRKQEKDSD
ncbi:MAG: 30S ribosomal protein S1 [Tagaea sp.]